jgi:hypothetical protein
MLTANCLSRTVIHFCYVDGISDVLGEHWSTVVSSPHNDIDAFAEKWLRIMRLRVEGKRLLPQDVSVNVRSNFANSKMVERYLNLLDSL